MQRLNSGFGSREENPLKQGLDHSVLIQSEPNGRQTRMGIPEARMGMATLPFASFTRRD
jgi:hypothetical protein